MSKSPELKAKELLFQSIDSILQERDLCLNKPEKSFSRVQKISFRDAMLYPIVVSNNSANTELVECFGTRKLPTLSAMIYRRNQIKSDAFEKLFHTFTSSIPKPRKYKGIRLVACDGTRLNTPYNPADFISYANYIEGRKGFNQLHLNTLYDVMNGCFLDAEIQGVSAMNEQKAFCQMIDRYPQDDKTVFVADRGYASFNVTAHLINNGFSFVIRLDSVMAANLFCSRMPDLSADSFDVEDIIHVGRRRTKQTRELPNYHYVSCQHAYDYIESRSSEVDSFRLRLLKFPIGEDSFEYILTNLPSDTFSLKTIKEIYGLRWGVETSFRHLKYAEGLVHIRSLKADFIRQEIYAKLIGYNFAMAVTKRCTSSKKKHRMYAYQIDKTNHIKMCMLYLKGIISSISGLIKKVPVRPDRSFNRNLRRQRADTLQYK